MVSRNERDRYLVALMREELANIGDELFGNSSTATNAWKRMEEAFSKRGLHAYENDLRFTFRIAAKCVKVVSFLLRFHCEVFEIISY